MSDVNCNIPTTYRGLAGTCVYIVRTSSIVRIIIVRMSNIATLISKEIPLHYSR